jgi:predicted amidophosphoribosyltransferase
LVFIRSALTTAVAVCEHYKDADHRSGIGALEHAAKYGGSNSAKQKLAEILQDVARRLYREDQIDVVASVPPSTAGAVGLPQFLASELGARMSVSDVTGAIKWNGPKPSLKELSVDEKWAALERVGTSIERSAVQGKSVLLVDDMYQSGTTVHFVGAALRAAGANDIHVLAVSKGRRDTDNT